MLTKYYPKNFDNIVGNKKKFKELTSILKKNNYNGKYLLTGPKGTGKTTFVELLSKQKKWKIHNINLTSLKFDNSIKCIFSKSIFKKIILIDDLDFSSKNLSKNIETKFKLIKKFIKNDKYNLIFIIATDYNGIFKNIKNIKIIKLQKNTDKNLYNFITKILNKEKITLSTKTKDKIISKLIKNSDNNIRQLLNNFEILTSNKKKIIFTKNNKNLLKKNKNDIIFTNDNDILNNTFCKYNLSNDVHLNFKENFYYQNPFLISANVFEHYPNGVECSNINVLNSISESIADADLLKSTKYDLYLDMYASYSNFIMPTQVSGNVNKQIYFPSNINKNNKYLNNIKKIQKNKNTKLFNYKTVDFNYISLIHKNKELYDTIFTIK